MCNRTVLHHCIIPITRTVLRKGGVASSNSEERILSSLVPRPSSTDVYRHVPEESSTCAVSCFSFRRESGGETSGYSGWRWPASLHLTSPHYCTLVMISVCTQWLNLKLCWQSNLHKVLFHMISITLKAVNLEYVPRTCGFQSRIDLC